MHVIREIGYSECILGFCEVMPSMRVCGQHTFTSSLTYHNFLAKAQDDLKEDEDFLLLFAAVKYT